MDRLAKAIGIPKAEARSIMEEVKINHANLEGCVGPHDFHPHKTHPGTELVSDYKCRKCDGTLSSINVYWYWEGQKHGKSE